jgi:CTD kinase subunit gamma
MLDALLVSIVDPIGYSSTLSEANEEKDLKKASTSSSATAASSYLNMAIRDLSKVVNAVVPRDDADAVRLNASSVQKILQTWKRLGIFEPYDVDKQLDILTVLHKENAVGRTSTEKPHFSKSDVLRRIEEDRERHKRLRERVWILPAKTFADCIPARAPGLRRGQVVRSMPSSKSNVAEDVAGSTLDAGDVEFEDAWESVSDLNDDDYEHIRESRRNWWGNQQVDKADTRKYGIVSNEQGKVRATKREPSPDAASSPSPSKRQKDEMLSSSIADGGQGANRWKRIGRTENEHHSWNNPSGPQARRSGHAPEAVHDSTRYR